MAVHSVSEVTKYIKDMFAGERALQDIMIRGELSNFKRYASGHCYFTLKDASASLKGVMFRSRAQSLRFVPVNGLKVVVTGSITVYERDGAYQLYADRMLPEGAGELALAFEQLKERLTAEGLFAPEHKKPLPQFPHTIGVVTSVSGAVLRDIYHVAKRRNPSVRLVLYPVQVQGDGSAAQVAAGIRFFNERYPVDVLIVGRGGGSAEDLWSFNEEAVVRAIYDSRLPVISAVGHETDYTLADFASDVRAATPSQAAELAVPDTAELARYVEALAARLRGQADKGVAVRKSRLLSLLTRKVLQHPHELLDARHQQLDIASEKLGRLARARLQEQRQALGLQLEKLELMDPMKVLLRGYGIVSGPEGNILRSAAGLEPGCRVQVRLADGSFAAVVESLLDGGK